MTAIGYLQAFHTSPHLVDMFQIEYFAAWQFLGIISYQTCINRLYLNDESITNQSVYLS